MSCLGCGATGASALFRLDRVPALCNALFEHAEEAKKAALVDIDLVACPACGLIWNRLFEPAAIDYCAEYGNPLECSATFREHRDRLVARLEREQVLEGKTILEVGCGDGAFLRALCGATGADGIGIDPSCTPAVENLERGALRLIRAQYPLRGEMIAADLICCRHVLEHMPDPHEFLERLEEDLAPHGKILIEVPNAEHMLEVCSIGDVIHEHCLYFDRSSLAALFESRGYGVELSEEFGGQFLVLTAKRGDRAVEARSASPSQELVEAGRSFGVRAREQVRRWRNRVSTAGSAGESLALWGVGSKGVTFLNLVNGEGPIAEAVDINPGKEGRFVPGTGHEVRSPRRLRDQPVDTVLVMNPQYVAEIEAELRSLGVSCSVEGVLG